MSRKKGEYSGLMLYFNVYGSLFEKRDNETVGKVMKMIYNYSRYKKQPPEEALTDGIDLVWETYRKAIDDDRRSYYEKCRGASWGNESRKIDFKDKDALEKARKEYFDRYDEEHRNEYMMTGIFTDLIENIEANEKMRAEIAKAKKDGRDAAATGRREIDPEDLPPVRSAALNPHKPEEDDNLSSSP